MASGYAGFVSDRSSAVTEPERPRRTAHEEPAEPHDELTHEEHARENAAHADDAPHTDHAG